APEGRPISNDGRFIVYHSEAGNLVNGFVDGNGQDTITAGVNRGDAYLYDRLTGANTLLSHLPSSPTTSGNGPTFGPQISGDGRFVGYVSNASDLLPGLTMVPYVNNIFLYDRLVGATALALHVAVILIVGGDYQYTFIMYFYHD